RGQLAAAKKLLQGLQPSSGREGLRGFEWYYLWRQCQFHRAELENREEICAAWQGAQPRLSPDGKTLAVALTDHTVTLWDLRTGKERATLQGASGPTWHLAFSPDGTFLVTAGGKENSLSTFSLPQKEKDDPSAREAFLWDASTGKRLARLAGSKNAIGQVAF